MAVQDAKLLHGKDVEAADTYPVTAAKQDGSSQDGEATSENDALLGWKQPVHVKSLSDAHASIAVPGEDASFWRKLYAFTGVGLMVSIGYMDPGNWATGLAGGSQFGYKLLVVILLSSFAAMFLQHLSLKLGVAAERDLAQVRTIQHVPTMRCHLIRYACPSCLLWRLRPMHALS
jgi:hypothetical protein